ncbi:hypothetical protein [Pedosphaera parvula]|uniref:Uncharacterized protein n=1 Tax=Pedosphaera parvula (strain Ellin514) TaxID=320771 RepID=B9XI50_PEDPL|nr:hypothetical protein [Pedosphaera parvula]EEF60543.1 hypothetical protein Cflav_PD3513 [Pedosphaera parvula Ellin514]
MPYALLQKNLEPIDVEKLRRAFVGQKRISAADAPIIASKAFGILLRSLDLEEAKNLNRALLGESIETDIVEERQLPALPLPKLIKQMELTPQAMILFDPLGRKVPNDWSQIAMLAAGMVKESTIQRTRKEWEVEKMRTIPGLMIPIRTKEKKFEYSSRETSEWSLRLEIVLNGGAARFQIAADDFNYACLGERKVADDTNNLCLLLRELANLAPQARLNQGATWMWNNEGEVTAYPRKEALWDEITWTLWKG